MSPVTNTIALALSASLLALGCGGDGDDTGSGDLHSAFAEFDADNTEIYIESENYVIETNGTPNHTSPYWGEGHPLYEADADVRLTPSIITDRDGSSVLRVSTSPQKAAQTTATTLGTIGISVSGAAIFNDQEGNGPLEMAIGSLDSAGAHIGPSVYHYHLEPKPITNDDDNLVGMLADGFFIYGRKCNSTGTYPTNLDDSGGHTHTTQHSDDDEYHYHIKNEVYLNEYYILFGSEFQGTPTAIN